ncbi:hypothetical protein Agub_g295 [Astrephomene gubernaculifera]|uniref:Magnesium transporter n=1 Tax=Astrephomene gubernaculifera TaxID=47775 RepID=A0AAD3DDK8_9CHLO|nr:hypothetical protein Agub_g295 [Astrephomene gubernaculifera]
MLQRLHASPSSQGYRPLASEALSHASYGHESSPQVVSFEAPPVRTTTMNTSKSFGDLKAVQSRSRGKKGRAIRWLVLRASGERQLFTLDKRQLIQTCRLEIPIRDMRLMDSALGTETLAQLLVRDNALVFSMEHVRLIIMADKVVVPLDEVAPLQPSSELKDRFISHLEGVVMDWALQHGAAAAEALAAIGGGGGGGNGGMLLSPSTHAPPPGFGMSHNVMGGGGGNGAVSGGGSSHHHGLPPPPAAVVVPVLPPPVSAATVAAAATAPPSSMSLQLESQQHVGNNGGSRMHAGLRAGAVGGGGGGMMGVLPGGGGGPGSETASQTAFDPEYQPFEMLVLETALSEICTHLSREVDALQAACQPALEALMKTADTANLEAVRRVKTHHARLVTRVTATKEALERLMGDDDDMVRMCLTQQAHMRVAALAAAAAAAHQQQQQDHCHHHHHHHHHGHHHSHHHSCHHSRSPGRCDASSPHRDATAANGNAETLTAAVADGGGGGGGADSGDAADGVDGLSYDSATSQPDAHQLAMLMGSSLPASPYMRPASLAAARAAVRHGVGKKGGGLGEALALAEAAAAAASGVGGGGVGVCPGGGGGVGGGVGGPGSGVGGGGGGAGSELVEHDFLDVENLLESYAIIVDTTYQTLMSIGEYIDDTEDLINIQLDFSRNKLIRFEILLTTGTFALAFFNIVTGVLGENLVLPDTITQDLRSFFLVNGGTMAFCLATYLALVTLFKWQKVL